MDGRPGIGDPRCATALLLSPVLLAATQLLLLVVLVVLLLPAARLPAPAPALGGAAPAAASAAPPGRTALSWEWPLLWGGALAKAGGRVAQSAGTEGIDGGELAQVAEETL